MDMERKGFQIIRRNAEIVVNIIMLCFSVFVIVYSLTSLEFWARNTPGPAFWPLAIGILMLFCNLLITKQIIKEKKDVPNSEIKEILFSNQILKRILSLLIPTLVAALLFKIVGALIVILAYMLFVLLFVAKLQKKRAILISVLFSVAVYVGFTEVLNIKLPAGILAMIL